MYSFLACRRTKRARALCSVSAIPFSILFSLLLTLLARPASAGESEAEQLFREGRALMLEGRFAEACPKIAESHQRDPRVGTLLNLAACHERLGQIATAWVELEKALIAARAEGQTDRERFAVERLKALEPRVPWLTIATPVPAPDDLAVTLDGASISSVAWGKELPVDPGAHVVTATAKGREPFEARFELRESEHRTVAVLGDLPNVIVVEPSPTAPPGPVVKAAPRRDFVPAYASLFHPAATNFDHPFAATRFGLNVLYGRAGELDAGLQLGTVNLIVGKEGVASGDMSGVQLAPLFGFNYASGHASGVQAAFWGNAAGGGVEGGQVSLAANVSASDLDGTQLALGVNVAAGRMRGVQFAALNIAGDAQGAQLGFINVAKKMDGVVVGLINVADDIDGVPIGLASVTRTGGVHPIFWASTATYANAGIKFATKHTYTMVAAHFTNVGADDYGAEGSRPPRHVDGHDFVGGGFFLGGHVPIDHAFVDFDLGISGLAAPVSSVHFRSDGTSHRYNEILIEPRLRVLGGYTLAEHASLFAGVGGLVRARLVDDGDDAIIRAMPELFGGIQF